MSPLHHAYLLKGWLLDKNPPQEVSEALEMIIAGLDEQWVTGSIEPLTIAIPPVEPESEENSDSSEPESPSAPVKRIRNWSPEARAAAAERMRKAREAKAGKKAEREATTERETVPAFTEPELRISVPAPRRTSHLADSDCPEIKAMLADGRSRESIASDYDEEVEDLNYFIASCQRREAKSPGEAGASPFHGASDAARLT